MELNSSVLVGIGGIRWDRLTGSAHFARTSKPRRKNNFIPIQEDHPATQYGYFWSTTSDAAHSLYVGSYGRNTAIKGFSDLDMLFQLPSSAYDQYDGYAGNGQSGLRQAIRKSIEKTYSPQHGRKLHLSRCEWRRKLEGDKS